MLLVSKAPLRISFCGGGTDIPDFFKNYEPSLVIGSSINAWVYVTALPLHSSAEENLRFTYRHTESVQSINEISHPSLKAILRHFDITDRLNLATFATLPGNSGLGSSSAFTVSTIALLNRHNSVNLTRAEIATSAVHIERDVLRESGGWQDQFHSSLGGFRGYTFGSDAVSYTDILLNAEDRKLLSKNMLLVKIGTARNSAKRMSGVMLQNREKILYLTKMNSISIELLNDLKGESEFESKFASIANAVNKSWELKQTYNRTVSKELDKLIFLGEVNGAIASKLCGAGGSGFVLFLYDSNRYPNFDIAFENYSTFKPSLIDSGVEVSAL
jgi:D-glycero-alpha-D-manno-heptose-7-phosphate kinase